MAGKVTLDVASIKAVYTARFTHTFIHTFNSRHTKLTNRKVVKF